MKNSDYWRDRMTNLAAAGFDESNAAYLRIADEYRKAISAIETDIAVWYQRIADNNEISLASARKLLKDNELEEFKWTVDEYIANGIINSVDQRFMKELENASAKVHINRLEALKLQLQNEIETLMAKMHDITSEHLEDTYTNRFYYSAYEIAKGTGVGQNLARLDKKKIAQVLMRPWTADGKNFSDRIWDNKDKLVNSLNKALTQHVIRGTAPKKIISEFTKTMGVSRNQAANIIQTETAAISSAAQKDCYKELDVKEYEIVETLDSRTCDVCADLDSKVFKMSEYQVGVTAPPFHPRCRGCTAPYFNDEFTINERRASRGEDGKYQLVPSDMSFKEWKAEFVQADSKVDSGLGAKIGDGKEIPLHEEPVLLKKINYEDKDNVLKELKSFEKNAIKEDIETACVITKDGEVFKCFGTVDRVFPDSDLKDKLKGASVTHNHPISETEFSFSGDDFDLFIEYELEVLRGCDEKYTYEFTRDALQIDEEPANWMSFENFRHVNVIQKAQEYGIGYRRWLSE